MIPLACDIVTVIAGAALYCTRSRTWALALLVHVELLRHPVR